MYINIQSEYKIQKLSVYMYIIDTMYTIKYTLFILYTYRQIVSKFYIHSIYLYTFFIHCLEVTQFISTYNRQPRQLYIQVFRLLGVFIYHIYIYIYLYYINIIKKNNRYALYNIYMYTGFRISGFFIQTVYIVVCICIFQDAYSSGLLYFCLHIKVPIAAYYK